MFAATQQIASVAGLKATKVQVSISLTDRCFFYLVVLCSFDRFKDTRQKARARVSDAKNSKVLSFFRIFFSPIRARYILMRVEDVNDHRSAQK